MIHKWIPSMFHRRLLLLGGGCALVLALLGLQVVRLTIAQGGVWKERAERVLATHKLVPTVRGVIYDRKGRVLAVDSPSYDVAVSYELIDGRWAMAQARLAASRANRHRWQQLAEAQKRDLAAPYLPNLNAQVESFWATLARLGGIDRAELQAKRRAVVERVERIAESHHRRARRKVAARRGEDIDDVTIDERPVREQAEAHPLLVNVSDDVQLFVRRMLADAAPVGVALGSDVPGQDAARDAALVVWRQVELHPSRSRAYPSETITVDIDLTNFPPPLRQERSLPVTVEGVAWQMIGDLRTVWADELRARPFSADDLGGYLPGDDAGRRGVELAMERALRGSRGRLVHYIDGSRQDEPTEPQPGRDVTMTLDVRLQARIQAVMSPQLGLMRVQPWHAGDLYKAWLHQQGTAEADEPPPVIDPLRPQLGDDLQGAAVVIDVKTGDVLAAVSVPTFSLKQMRDAPQAVWDDRLNQPYLNRAIARPYRPGSTVKPVVFAAAVTDNLIGPFTPISCQGLLNPDKPGAHRCWIFKSFGSTHDAAAGHPLAGREAIARSCNIFFYTLGRRFGGRRLVWWYDAFGLGHVLDVGLGDESPGELPPLERAGESGVAGFTEGDAIMMGIGQGPVDWTVLQAANAYATLARGGKYVAPALIGDESRRLSDPSFTRRREDLRLNQAALAEALAGLHDAITQSYGTGHHFALIEGRPPIFNVPEVKVYGKSGTAAATPLAIPIDDDGDGKIDRYSAPQRTGDHAWFIGLAQRPGSTRPDYAIAVVVEFGGSGGAVAGPIANQIIWALKAEGYL